MGDHATRFADRPAAVGESGDIHEVAKGLVYKGGSEALSMVRQFAEWLRKALYLDAATRWDDVAAAMKAILNERDAALLLEDSSRRRCWFLSEALKRAPLREALEIARAAETFLVMGRVAVPATQPASPHEADRRRENQDRTSGAFAPHNGAGRYLH